MEGGNIHGQPGSRNAGWSEHLCSWLKTTSPVPLNSLCCELSSQCFVMRLALEHTFHPKMTGFYEQRLGLGPSL